MDNKNAGTAPKRNLFHGFKQQAALHPYFLTVCALFVVSVVVYVVSRFSTVFAEFWVRHMSIGVRFITAMLTAVFPFSVAEALILFIPVIIAVVVWISLRDMVQNKGRKLKKILLSLVSVLMVVCIIFGLGFGPCYFRNSLAENLGLEDKPVSGQSLYETAAWLSESIDEVLPGITFSSAGESHMPYSFYDLTAAVNEAFNEYSADKDFITGFTCPVKMVALSDLMTYTHISGVYAFFTGEANVNVNYPDFIVPFTVAHEMSHQRGIAREDEANFIAFLVCAESDDAYIRYSGYINVLREVMSALYKSDRELYSKFRKNYYPNELVGEINAYSKFFEKYRESTAAKVVSGTNNAYLSSQNVKAGVKSYGLVTDLAVAFYETVVKDK